MIHEEKKVAKIVEELTIFFFGIGGSDIASQIKKEGRDVVISFESNYALEYEYKVERMEEFLKEQKNEGIGEIYWELAGSGDPGETSQLLLIGMMVDDAKVNMKDGKVYVELRKNMCNLG